MTDVHQFHKQWDLIINRGRRVANVGRFFRDKDGKGPLGPVQLDPTADTFLGCLAKNEANINNIMAYLRQQG